MFDDQDYVPSSIDWVVTAYQDDDEWQVLMHDAGIADSLDTLVEELRRYPAPLGAIAMVSIDEEFFVLVRTRGSSTKVLISDLIAADASDIDSDLIDDALDVLGIDPSEEDDDEDPVPGGDLDLLQDYGFKAAELESLCSDPDAYPEETLAEIAKRLGFGPAFDDLIDM